MSGRARIRPSKPMSAVGMFIGIVLIMLGLFSAIPRAGLFGIFWTLCASAATLYFAVNLFSHRGIAQEVVEFEGDLDGGKDEGSVESRLQVLESLKQKGLVNDQEYSQQREKILKEL